MIQKFKLILIAIAFLVTTGCARPQLPAAEQTKPTKIEMYEEASISLPRLLGYYKHKKTLSAPLAGAPAVKVRMQGMFSKVCGVCTIFSVGNYFKSNWSFDEIKKSVMGTHKQGTSVTAVVKWFNDKNYKKVKLYRGYRDPESMYKELRAGGLIIALIYSFRDGFGPNHFVIVSHTDGSNLNIVDSRIGSYSMPAEDFCSRSILVQGTWVAIKP